MSAVYIFVYVYVLCLSTYIHFSNIPLNKTSSPIIPNKSCIVTRLTSTDCTAVSDSLKRKQSTKDRCIGANNWKPSDVTVMLQQIRATLPRAQEEWQTVTSNYNRIQDENCNID